MSLALWLRAGRTQRGMSLDDVARVTKIQARILERLETGKLDGLPAEVFVRGFVRSFAKCVGLDEAEALRRYRDAASQPGASTARALVESMSELAPVTARSSATRLPTSSPSVPAVATTQPASPIASEVTNQVANQVATPAMPETRSEPAPVEAAHAAIEPTSAVPTAAESSESTSAAASTTSSKRKKKSRGKNRKRKPMALGTPAAATPVMTAQAGTAQAAEADTNAAAEATSQVEPARDLASEPANERANETSPAADTTFAEAAPSEPEPAPEIVTASPAEPWTPRMPTVVAPTVPWRRPAYAVTHAAPARAVPSLVIDDADPELAEREREDRAAAKEPTRRMFLPPILLDREDRSARQGGLTLAVIILLIAATLTLSYLMRRPSSSGDGVTQAPPAAHVEPEQLA